MKSELIPLDGSPPIAITRDLTVVGRRESCDVVLPHASLSKQHCVLVRTDGLLVVRDLISTNGTKVNGQRVMWAALLPNDRLTLGRLKFKVYLGPDDLPGPSAVGRPAVAAPGPAAAVAAQDFALPSSEHDLPAAPRGAAPPRPPASPPASPFEDDDLEFLDE